MEKIGIINVKIKGLSPLLMNRQTIEDKKAKKKEAEKSMEELVKDAENLAYRTKDGYLYIPAVAIYHSILNGAKDYKVAGRGKMSLATVIRGGIRIVPDEVIIKNSKGEPVKDYEVDIRYVRIPRTGGKVLKARPKINEWFAEFQIHYWKKVIEESIIKMLSEVIDYAGFKCGLLDFRPEKGGEFGRYAVDEFKIVK